ncbi:neprilysin-2-like isoform X2 [Photinus pyralis]|uniref:neprilysin-2-like isoform X2 n=1 Tax=Photinus pyralis TaxID=7054 RepID=UPI00126731A2|nr:neprilysin-2-like isoform X2 [Photinus pyralis]
MDKAELGKEVPNSHFEPLQLRKTSTKLLVILTTIAFVLLLSTLIGLIVMFTIGRKNKDVCFTPTCVHSAGTTLIHMDPGVNPCDNFYKFACGNFVKDTIIPDGKQGVNIFLTASEVVNNKLNGLFDEPLPMNASNPRKMVDTLYKSCMDLNMIEEDGLKTVSAVLKRLGGWPLLEGSQWNHSRFEWDDQIYEFRKHGCIHEFFITLALHIDSRNMSRRILLDEAHYDNKFLNGLDDFSVRAYYRYILELADELGIDNKTASNEVRDVINFKAKLAKMSQDTIKTPKSGILISIEKLQESYPKINWLKLVRNVVNHPSINITNSEQVVLQVPKYVEELQELLEKTPKRTIANYMFVETVDTFVPYLYERLRLKRSLYHTTPKLDLSSKARMSDCKRITVVGIGLEFDHLYVKKYFNEQTKQQAEDLAQNILNEFSETLRTVDWLDDETRKSAIEKVNNMVKHIAYPSELLDYSNVEKYYDKLEINANTFLENAMSIRKFQMDKHFSKLHRPFNKTDWLSHTFPAVVNAFYSPYENSIVLPAGILQGAFFNKDRPNYMNYAVVGFIVGHEMTHGFDNRGRLCDKEGCVRNWWSDKTQKAFLEKAQCIIEQYGNYTFPELNLTINGVNTLGENIADNGGIKQAYSAYNKWAKLNKAELQLPGLNYTPNQMFWISAAQIWCSKYTDKYFKYLLKHDPHSPAEYRIIGPFSNSENFTRDFNCPLGSPMNPIKKCSVW